jgi:hypothetical protein
LAQTPTNPPTATADYTHPPISSSKDETVFYIRSSGLIADSTFIALSVNGGGSAMSEQLALILLQARDHATQITVAGSNESKALRVIKDALDSAGPVDPSLLNFTFFGSPKAAVRVGKWVTAVHGAIHTRPTLNP